MRLLKSYFKDVLEVNKNTELLEYLETNLLGMVEYQVKLENFVKQSSLDDEFIKNKLLVKHARFKSMLNEIVSNPYNIVYELNDEEKKIERFFKSDKIYSTNSNTINIIGEYRKLTSFASKLFENVKSIKFVFDDLENQKNVLEILNQTIEVFRRELDEYWTANKQKVFDKFKNFTFKRTFTEVDFVASFKKQGLDSNDYDWIDCGPVDPAIVEKDQEWFDLFIHKTTQEHFKILDRDHVMVENEYECLLFKELKSFKNRSKKSFWKHTRLGDWDENGLRPNAIEFVMNEEMLKKCVKSF